MKSKILLFLATISLGLIVLEIAARRMPTSWVYDPVVGHRGKAGAEGYNHFGFRSPEPRNGPSLYLYGDSITEATGIAWERTYAHLLEAQLKKNGTSFNLVSWANTDYGTAESFLLLEQQNPDFALLQFLGINDFINNGIGFAGQNKSFGDFARPYFDPQSEKFVYLHPIWKGIRDRSHLVQRLEFFWQEAQWKKRSAQECGPELEVFLQSQSAHWSESYAATGGLLRAFQRKMGKRLLAFYVPSFFEVYGPVWENAIVPQLRRCFSAPFNRENPEKHFLDLARQNGVQAISLKRFFLRSPLSPDRLFLTDGHLSSEGHALVANALSQILQSPPFDLDKALPQR